MLLCAYAAEDVNNQSCPPFLPLVGKNPKEAHRIMALRISLSPQRAQSYAGSFGLPLHSTQATSAIQRSPICSNSPCHGDSQEMIHYHLMRETTCESKKGRSAADCLSTRRATQSSAVLASVTRKKNENQASELQAHRLWSAFVRCRTVPLLYGKIPRILATQNYESQHIICSDGSTQTT